MSRYIDADMLYVDWYDSFVADDGTVYDNFPLISKEQIDDAPTIEPKRGRWIRSSEIDIAWGSKTYTCSNCGRKQNDMTNFCCECGADMRKSN